MRNHVYKKNALSVSEINQPTTQVAQFDAPEPQKT